MKEMVGGCCVCSDERGWPDNPLVYCDGIGCTVAVHQACYGIVTVPTGPWFCRKCESPDKQSKVKCELCPSRSGALKRSDNDGWAHVVCALYIPEVRFGNVTSMEPIILQLIPPERFSKTCYICHEANKISRANVGACMQCNKSGCKQQFHVTCAQSLGLLCEEAGNYLDNVKYCGYCRHHYSKLKKGGNVKTIPPYKPVSQDSPSSDSGPEKEPDPSPSNSNAEIAPSPSTSGVSKASSSKSGSGRKSGQQGSSTTTKGSTSDAPSGSATMKISPQSKSTPTSKVATPQAAKSTEKAPRKKTPPPSSSESQRRASGSATETVVSNTIVTPTVSPVGASNQNNRAKSTPLSPSNKIPPNQQEPFVLINGIRVTSAANSSGTSTVTHSQQQSAQKYNSATTPSYTESVITANDSSFNSAAANNSSNSANNNSNSVTETKQTKKRKAVSQAAAASYTPNTITAPPAQPPDNSSAMQWEPSTQPTDLTPDSSSEDKTKKMRTDGTHIMPAVITKPPAPNTSGSSNNSSSANVNSNNNSSNNSNSGNNSMNTITPLEEGATTTTQQQVQYGSSSSNNSNIVTQQQGLSQVTQPMAGPSQTPVISTDKHSSRLPSPAPPVSQMSNVSGQSSSIRSTMPSSVTQQPHTKYPNLVAPMRLEDPQQQAQLQKQSSLVVSVPLSHASQASVTQKAANSKPSTSAASMSDAVFVEPATPSWGGLRTSYEPQVGQPPIMDQSEDLRRPRAESLDMCKPSVIQVDDKSIAGTSGIRNKKRSPIPSPQMQMPAPTPGTSGTSSYHVPTHNASMSRGIVKRGNAPSTATAASSAPMAMPSTSSQQQQQQQHQEILDSPPSSPGTLRNIKVNLDRMGRAPHMLGNELNPESAAAARLSEQLNAELAAHSVFRAPSPAIPPPLINKASSARQSSNSSSGPQSLDQLLERQWEQGSQFLMEQAQHFDIASLLSCLHQLRTENVRLEEHVNSLVQRRDHLLAVNARLAIPFSAGVMPPEPPAPPPPPPPRPRNVDGMMDGRSQQLIREPQRKSS